MRWPWRKDAPPLSTGGQEAHEEARARLREVRKRGPEIAEAIRQLRAALDSTTSEDPFIEGVRREFGRRA